MSFLVKIFGGQPAPIELDVSALLLMPAIIRIGIAGKDPHQDLEALTHVAAKSPLMDGLAPEDIMSKALVLSKTIHQTGLAAAMGKLQANLSAQQRMEAMQLAVASTCASTLLDTKDIGILAAMSEKLGMQSAEFDQLFEQPRLS